MKPVLNFVVLLMSLLIVRASPHSQTQKETRFAQRVPPGAESSSANNEMDDEENQEANLIGNSEDEEPSNEGILSPSLTCILFDGNNACNAMCSMIGSIYGHVVGMGICQNKLRCDCPISSYATLDDLWNAKFNANLVLNEIHRDKKLPKKVTNVLKKSLRTREQTLQDLQSILTPEQLRKIKVNDTIAKVLKIDGEPDRNALKKYVTKKLASEGITLIDNVDLSLLDDFFKNSEKESFAQIIREIRRSDSTPMNSYLDDLIKKRGIHEPSKDTHAQQTYLEILDSVIAADALSPSKFSPRPTWRPPQLRRNTRTQ